MSTRYTIVVDGRLDPRWSGEFGSLRVCPQGDGTTALSLEYGDVPLEDTASTLPSMRAAQRSVQDYFDGTQSVSMSMEGVDDAMEAEQAAGSAGTQPNRRSPLKRRTRPPNPLWWQSC